jgi:hypothetical protein
VDVLIDSSRFRDFPNRPCVAGEKRQMQVSRLEVQMACAMCGLGRCTVRVYSTDLLCRAGGWVNAAARLTAV